MPRQHTIDVVVGEVPTGRVDCVFIEGEKKLRGELSIGELRQEGQSLLD